MIFREVLFQGNIMHLGGRLLRLNSLAPEFKLINNDMNEINLNAFSGKIKVITSAPSLDTPICELQAKTFNKQAIDLSSNIDIIFISKDLPFAQKRFCIDQNIRNISILSDYKDSSFGINYGFIIQELNLLARAVIIVDQNNVVRYIQIAKEITTELNYNDVLKSLKLISNSITIDTTKSYDTASYKTCNTITQLPLAEIIERLPNLNNWQLINNKKLVRTIKFNNFFSAKFNLNTIVTLLENQGHHACIKFEFNMLQIVLHTHGANGITENDMIIAKLIDDILS